MPTMSRQWLPPKTPHKVAAAGCDGNRLNAGNGGVGKQQQQQQQQHSVTYRNWYSAEHGKPKRTIQSPKQQQQQQQQPPCIFSNLCNNCPYKASLKSNSFSTQSCTNFNLPSPAQRWTPADYRIYEDGDLLQFFARTNCQPKRVSEVCLVNDHYILVKMPDSCWRRNSEIESIAEQLVEQTNKGHSLIEGSASGASVKMGSTQTRTRWPNTNSNSTSPSLGHPCPLAKYLQGKRNRKVSPMRRDNPTPIDLTKQHKKKNTAELRPTIEQEVFRSHTRIKKIAVESSTIQEAPLDLSVKRTKHVTIEKDKGPTESHSSISLKSSVHNDVELEHRGLMLLAGDLPFIDEEVSSSQDILSARSNAANSGRLRWLIQPFRRRPKLKVKPKPKKPKPTKSKVQAVVYKTYFVSWKKPPEPEQNAKCSLRRSRSALF